MIDLGSILTIECECCCLCYLFLHSGRPMRKVLWYIINFQNPLEATKNITKKPNNLFYHTHQTLSYIIKGS